MNNSRKLASEQYVCPYANMTVNNDDNFVFPDFVCKTATHQVLDVLNSMHSKRLLADVAYKNRKNTTDPIKLNKCQLASNLKIILEHNLRFHVFTRLYKSHFGVGVKAIRDIPAGVTIFDSTTGPCANYEPVSFSTRDVQSIFKSNTDSAEAVTELLKDFYLGHENNEIAFPINALGVNMLDVSFFLNHSTTPNVEIMYIDQCDMSLYRTSRFVNKGEELCIDYNRFKTPKSVLYKYMPFLMPADCDFQSAASTSTKRQQQTQVQSQNTPAASRRRVQQAAAQVSSGGSANKQTKKTAQSARSSKASS